LNIPSPSKNESMHVCIYFYLSPFSVNYASIIWLIACSIIYRKLQRIEVLSSYYRSARNNVHSTSWNFLLPHSPISLHDLYEKCLNLKVSILMNSSIAFCFSEWFCVWWLDSFLWVQKLNSPHASHQKSISSHIAVILDRSSM
jgi:hypothetical protein